MTSKGRNKRLAQFGAEVLTLLANEDDWDSDTLDSIGEAAVNLDLAKADTRGLFMQTDEGKQ